MRFSYTYRSSDGQRHTAEIEAESRDAAFGAIRRERGVKPIRVTAADGPAAPRRPRVATVLLAGLALVAVLAGAFLWGRRPRGAASYRVLTPQGPVTLSVAQPLPRQRIPGDRRRIEGFPTNLFAHAAEAWLARYAEPGRPADGAAPPAPPEWERCLREPVRVASTDYTEWVDLKRIVAGMKREMQAYLAGGGTAAGYQAELAKRQKLEASYRERAGQRLAELLKGQSPDLAAAYAYWLKANAQLKAMGIWELPLPDALRAYQMGLDINE